MKLTIFGASGGTGSHLVSQALAAGHQVTAVVRDPARLAVPAHPGLDVAAADVMEPAAIRDLVTGRDAVISAIGPSRRPEEKDKPTPSVCARSARSIVAAMSATGTGGWSWSAPAARSPTGTGRCCATWPGRSPGSARGSG